jgi:DNA-binding response OmpR family regulator
MSAHPTPAALALQADVGPRGTLAVGDVEIDLDAMLVRRAGEIVPMPLQEYVLLHLLMEHPGRVLSRRYLLDHAWQPGHPDAKSLNVHIYRLRTRLRPATGPSPLRTVRNVGYVFDPPAPVAPPTPHAGTVTPLHVPASP